jgi:hypothetical protein
MERLDSRVIAFTFIGLGIIAACTTDGGGSSSGGTSSGGTSGSTSGAGGGDGGGTGGGDGGGGGACRGKTGQACFDCCGETETTFVAAEDAFIKCACVRTECTTECGVFCGELASNPSAEPNEACGTCLESEAIVTACDPEYSKKCEATPECKKVADCARDANCPPSGDDDDDDDGGS